jgi:pyruvate kinase
MKHQFKKVKIVATLGPASETQETINRLAEEGVDVFRLNLSHRKPDEIAPAVSMIRRAEKETGRPLAVLGDLAGPKIRIGNVKEGVVLKPGDKVEFTREPVAESDGKKISVNYPSAISNLEPGAEIYIGDGIIKLSVEKKTATGVLARVVVGGDLVSRRGFSGQGLVLDEFVLSEKDKGDIKKLLKEGVDALAVSFVQTEKDIQKVRDLLPSKNRPMVIAKIETLAAIHNIEKIIDLADGIMIARGDLGFSIPIEQLPLIQKNLISLALKKAKPVITATQMLESMTGSHFPTRAEVTDVANAILDGTDAVMLSGETSLGKYPVEVVRMMTKIIRATSNKVAARDYEESGMMTDDAISTSVVKVADRVKAPLVIALTQTGMTARLISRHRHQEPILALSPDPATLRHLNFTWGVSSKLISPTKDLDELTAETRKIALKNEVVSLKKGESFVIAAGIPFGKSGSTNLVLVQKI